MSISFDAIRLSDALEEGEGAPVERVARWLSFNIAVEPDGGVVGDAAGLGVKDHVYVLYRQLDQEWLWVVPGADFDRIEDFSNLAGLGVLTRPEGWRALLGDLLPSRRAPGPRASVRVEGSDQRVQPILDDGIVGAAAAFQALRLARAGCSALTTGPVPSPPPDAWRLDQQGQTSLVLTPPPLAGWPRLALLAGALALLSGYPIYRGVLDRDGDGYVNAAFGGTDCADREDEDGIDATGAAVKVLARDRHPGVNELCNSVDDDCDDLLDAADERFLGERHLSFPDFDNDRHGDQDAVGALTCLSAVRDPLTVFDLPDDCDDRQASIHPGAPDGRDDLDNDCDGNVDEDAADAVVSEAVRQKARDRYDKAVKAVAAAAARVRSSVPKAPAETGCGPIRSQSVREMLGAIGGGSELTGGKARVALRGPADCAQVHFTGVDRLGGPADLLLGLTEDDLGALRVVLQADACADVQHTIDIQLFDLKEKRFTCILKSQGCAFVEMRCGT